MDVKDLLQSARPIVARRVKRAGLSDADREDVLQDVIVKYLVAFADDAPRNPAGWLERTTERTLIDRYRAAHRRTHGALLEEGEPGAIPTLVAAWRDATATSWGAMKQLVVREALGLLSDADREIFKRKYLRGERSADMAVRFGVSVNTVDQRASRARRRLKKALEERPELLSELADPHPRVY